MREARPRLRDHNAIADLSGAHITAHIAAYCAARASFVADRACAHRLLVNRPIYLRCPRHYLPLPRLHRWLAQIEPLFVCLFVSFSAPLDVEHDEREGVRVGMTLVIVG